MTDTGQNVQLGSEAGAGYVNVLYGAAAVVFALIYLVVMRQVTRLTGDVLGQNLPVVQAGLLVRGLSRAPPSSSSRGSGSTFVRSRASLE